MGSQKVMIVEVKIDQNQNIVPFWDDNFENTNSETFEMVYDVCEREFYEFARFEQSVKFHTEIGEKCIYESFKNFKQCHKIGVVKEIQYSSDLYITKYFGIMTENPFHSFSEEMREFYNQNIYYFVLQRKSPLYILFEDDKDKIYYANCFQIEKQ